MCLILILWFVFKLSYDFINKFLILTLFHFETICNFLLPHIPLLILSCFLLVFFSIYSLPHPLYYFWVFFPWKCQSMFSGFNELPLQSFTKFCEISPINISELLTLLLYIWSSLTYSNWVPTSQVSNFLPGTRNLEWFGTLRGVSGFPWDQLIKNFIRATSNKGLNSLWF